MSWYPIEFCELWMSFWKWTKLVKTSISIKVIGSIFIRERNCAIELIIRPVTVVMNIMWVLNMVDVSWMGIAMIVVNMMWNMLVINMVTFMTLDTVVSVISVEVVSWSLKLMLMVVVFHTVSLSDINCRWTFTLSTSSL